MGLIVTEINELRERLKNFDAGKITTEELMAAVHVYAQTERRMRLYLTAMALGMKEGGQKVMRDMIGEDKIDESKEPYDRTKDRGK